jgi:outer membrane protein assembly factor BamB
VALDASTGRERWRFASESASLSAAAVVDGSVYVGLGDNAGSLVALDAGSGEVRWRFPTARGVEGAPVVAAGVVYALDAETLYALDASDGHELWRFQVYVTDNFDADPTVVDGVVYVPSGYEFLYAIGGA